MVLNLEMIRGDTAFINFKIITEITLDLNLLDFNITFSVKQTPDSSGYVFQKSKNSVTQITTNTFSLRIAPEDTVDLVPGLYFYDLQITIFDDVFTISIGQLNLQADITRPNFEYPSFPYPDINNDGLITLADAEIIRQAYIDIMTGQPTGLTPAQENLCDANRDGHIDIIDSSLVKSFVEQCAAGIYINNAAGWTAFMKAHYIPR